jgi:hypothetical protein
MLKIIDLSIKYDTNTALVIVHRLRCILAHVNDGESPVAKSDHAVSIYAAVIGTSMSHKVNCPIKDFIGYINKMIFVSKITDYSAHKDLPNKLFL